MDGRAADALPDGVSLDNDNSDRPAREMLRYRATVPSWCADDRGSATKSSTWHLAVIRPLWGVNCQVFQHR